MRAKVPPLAEGVTERNLARAELERATHFLALEAALLDDRDFTAWVELFEDDGVYWMPSQPGQRSPADALSIFHEPKALLAIRAARLARPDVHVQNPASRTHHHVSGILVAPAGGESAFLEVRSMQWIAEWRSGDERWFSARCQHRLRRRGATYGIVEKRVDLINCDAPHRAIAMPI